MAKSSVIQIEKPGPPSIVVKLAPLVKQAHGFQVVDVDSDRIAQERGVRLRNGKKAIEEHFAKAKKDAAQAHKSIVASVAGLCGPFDEASHLYFAASDHYQEVEKEKARQQERQLEIEARKIEEEKHIQDAIDAEAMGEPEQADAIMDEKPEPVALSVAPQVAKVSGASSRLIWSAEIHDFKSLVRYVADHPEWESLLECDRLVESHPNLNRLAVSQQKALAIPGVRAVSKRSRR